MAWQIFITVFLLLSVSNFLVRRHLAVTLASHNLIINFIFYVCTLFPIGLLITAISQPDLNIGLTTFLLFAVGQIIFPLNGLVAFKASRHVDAGTFTILNNLTPLITIVIAWNWLHETLTTTQVFGAILIIFSAFLITLPNLKHHRRDRDKDVLLALASAVLLGVAIVYERYLLKRVDVGTYVFYGWGFQAFWAAIFAWPVMNQLSILRYNKHRYAIGAYSLGFALSGLCFVEALKLSGNASLISSIMSFRTVLVVIGAWIFLREKTWIWLKLACAAIGIIGLIVLNSS